MQRAANLMALGAPMREAAEIAARQGKGHVGELQQSASYSVRAGMLNRPFHARPNPKANDPYVDVELRRGSRRRAAGAQVKVGSSRYVLRAAQSGRHEMLVVNSDATTTLEVPRELARRDDVPRCVSVFLTPSGRASTMLFENDSRKVRLDELEAQYYGAILAEDWGEGHLAGHQGELWVGAGCRDISAVLSNELVQLHASILARQVRRSSSSPEAKISVWMVDDATSAVRAVEVAVQDPIREARDTWTVVSHAGISAKLNALRAAKLPAETGGLIVGYIDHPLRRIFIVDVLPAPSDSEGTRSGFVRGTDGLLKVLDTIRDRTAGIVGYLGEWHSHPPRHTPRPSRDDVNLLVHCAMVLARDGVPALMVIVGRAGEISYSLGLRGEPSASSG